VRTYPFTILILADLVGASQVLRVQSYDREREYHLDEAVDDVSGRGLGEASCWSNLVEKCHFC